MGLGYPGSQRSLAHGEPRLLSAWGPGGPLPSVSLYLGNMLSRTVVSLGVRAFHLQESSFTISEGEEVLASIPSGIHVGVCPSPL